MRIQDSGPAHSTARQQGKAGKPPDPTKATPNMSTTDDSGQDRSSSEPSVLFTPAGVPLPKPRVPPHEPEPLRKARFVESWELLPTEPYELAIPTLQKGREYDVDFIMLHAAFGLLRWFLDNEFPGHREWFPEDLEEIADLSQWWETHWNKDPWNIEADDEILIMFHRLVEISTKLWI